MTLEEKRREAIQLARDYAKTFETEHGGRVLADLELHCGFRKPSFDRDPIIMAWNEGHRDVVLRIHAQLSALEDMA